MVFLQEMLCAEEAEKLCSGWVGRVYYSVGSRKSKVVMILINTNLNA